MSKLKVDLALVQKYNVPGPRYTSYPPATRFTDQVAWPALAEEILQNNKTERHLSLYFHIPFCQTLCWYCGCTTVITTQNRQSVTYLDYLKKELAQMSTLLNPKRKVVQLHFGGGTPTFLSPEEIRALGRLIHDHFNLADDVEAGVEIDPRRLTRDHLVALREVGFNRASVGVQDFDGKVQEAVHRLQPREMTQRVIDDIRELGFASVNIDLIYGLPHQTAASFEKTLDAVLEVAPDRLAVFSYAHVPWIKPAQKILENDALPSAEVKLQLLKLIIEKLTDQDRYIYIGMDHFARPNDELAVAQRKKTLQRNFQGYSTRGGTDIYGFGMSSISQIENAYWQNQKELKTYYAALDAGKAPLAKGYFVNDDDKVRRQTIMRLMCDLALNYAAMSKKLGVHFTTYFARELDSLADLEADRLVRKTAGGLEVTEIGRLFIRNIAMRFDAYLPQEKERRFSRTI
ncbi:MAG: oxygen-independent coproporphyrinogen III oxidase [Verrucomicrobiota bacterium]